MSMDMPVLILGGARSGKSSFAEKLLCETHQPRTYLATGFAGDAEMAARIAQHKADRGEGWQTVEEPLEIVDALRRETEKGRAVLLDCLTLWLSNLFMQGHDAAQETARLVSFLQEAPRPIVLVSNEIGLGLVPETKLGRDFRDAQGRLNQAVAAAVPRVIFVAAGLPLYLKGPA